MTQNEYYKTFYELRNEIKDPPQITYQPIITETLNDNDRLDNFKFDLYITNEGTPEEFVNKIRELAKDIDIEADWSSTP